MNNINIEHCEMANKPIVSRRAIVKFIRIMIYLYIYAINYKIIYAYFNKKVQEKVDVELEKIEEEELKLILPVEEEDEYVDEYEFRGEQLRRLRSYNPSLPDETDEEYTNRILNMAYQEDKEEENQKVANEVVSSANEIVAVLPLERHATVWYKFEDGKGRYKGEWKNGLPNGKGIKHSYKDDSYIYGNFVDGFSEGYGKQTFEQTWEKTQPYYEGEFKRNNYHGKGEYHYGDGDYYKGDWKDSKYNGQGAAYSKRLDKTWVGEYENDVKGEGNWVKGEI
jgi:hypothetical protein